MDWCQKGILQRGLIALAAQRKILSYSLACGETCASGTHYHNAGNDSTLTKWRACPGTTTVQHHACKSDSNYGSCQRDVFSVRTFARAA